VAAVQRVLAPEPRAAALPEGPEVPPWPPALRAVDRPVLSQSAVSARVGADCGAE